MGFKDCILSAVEQGALEQPEAEDLIARYEAHLASVKAETRNVGDLPATACEQGFYA